MSSDLQITGGGAIAVDPEQMRAVSDRMAAVAARLTDAGESVRRAHGSLIAAWSTATRIELWALWATAQRLADEGEALASDAAGTAIMADAFELADLRAEQDMLSTQLPAAADRLQARIDALLDSNPELDAMASTLTSTWQRSSTAGLLAQPLDAIAWGALSMQAAVPVWILAGLLRSGTRVMGTVPSGTGITGGAPPVVVRRVSTASVDGSAVTLKQLVTRLPGGKAQVAVEKRTHADGAVSFVAYIDGTRSMTSGGDDPWDMGSNWDLYVDREQSAAYAATLEALQLAGAEEGARVDLVGYSQGAAIAGAVAMSGMYETPRVMIVGSPAVPSLETDQTLIRVFHTDDPVGAGLTAGGPAYATGSPESITVSREYATRSELSSVPSHFRDAYDETIAQAETSGDARVKSLHESLRAEAHDIVSVERMEFQATRP
ncbi:hypothetical protein ACIPV2_09555 [Microbacterium sp. NPDC089987]|uniref:hypothetical protein n=1 Tax=Microbacterium sp. NPDC089987 TaxID=3364202 RepID=UPI00382D6AC5